MPSNRWETTSDRIESFLHPTNERNQGYTHSARNSYSRRAASVPDDVGITFLEPELSDDAANDLAIARTQNFGLLLRSLDTCIHASDCMGQVQFSRAYPRLKPQLNEPIARRLAGGIVSFPLSLKLAVYGKLPSSKRECAWIGPGGGGDGDFVPSGLLSTVHAEIGGGRYAANATLRLERWRH